MTLWENVLAHYGWQGAALAAVLVVLLCVQLWYYLFAYGRIPGYKNSRRRQVLDAEPPLSVIVPMFSEDALFVEERLPLMLAQEYSDFEVVIVYVGRDNDFFEDLLRIRQSFPRVTATKIEQDARFPISTKMALNVGIKSAHYEHLIVTSTDVRPLSDRWLALMAKGFLRDDNLSVVLSPRASVVQRVWGGLGWWTRQRRLYGAARRYYPLAVRNFIRWEPGSRLLFFLAAATAIAVMPLEYKLATAALVLLRYGVVFAEIWRITRRLGERGLRGAYFVYDLLSPFYEMLVALLCLRRDDRVWR